MGNTMYPIYVKTDLECFPKEHKYFNFNDEINEDIKKYVTDVVEKSTFENFMNEYVYRDQSNKLYIDKSNNVDLKMQTNVSKLLNYKYDCDVVSYIVDTYKGRGYGVFANDFIEKDSIICRCNKKIYKGDKDIVNKYCGYGVSEIINDLNYYPFMNEYEYHRMDMIEKNINVSTVCINGILYLKAIKDIKKGEELSRLYGINFWFNENNRIDEDKIRSLLELCITKHKIHKMMKEKNYKIASYDDNIDLFGDEKTLFKLTFLKKNQDKEEYLKPVPFNMDDGNYLFYSCNDHNNRIFYVSVYNGIMIEYIDIDNNEIDNLGISLRYYYENNEWFVDMYGLTNNTYQQIIHIPARDRDEKTQNHFNILGKIFFGHNIHCDTNHQHDSECNNNLFY